MASSTAWAARRIFWPSIEPERSSTNERLTGARSVGADGLRGGHVGDDEALAVPARPDEAAVLADA